MTSPETGVGVVGGGGDTVKRGDGGWIISDALPSLSSLLPFASGALLKGALWGISDSGESTTVCESCRIVLLGASRALLGSSFSSSSADLRPNVGARGVLSSRISSSGLSLIGGNLESPSNERSEVLHMRAACYQHTNEDLVGCHQ